MFWINGPENFCYLSEQRQWRNGLSFNEVLEWKQCAPSGLVSQRFSSLLGACEAFEGNRVIWSNDLYLKRMGDQMFAHRSVMDYRPTAMKLAEAQGAPLRIAPWVKEKELNNSSLYTAQRCKWSGPVKEFHLARFGEDVESLHSLRCRRSVVINQAR